MTRQGAPSGLRLIVCGGRSYTDSACVAAVLDRVHAERGIAQIIQGGAVGADALAKAWADDRGVECIEVRADWQAHGRAAGPIRNGQMLELEPDVVIAFPGGRGTADMCRQAATLSVKVWRPLDRAAMQARMLSREEKEDLRRSAAAADEYFREMFARG